MLVDEEFLNSIDKKKGKKFGKKGGNKKNQNRNEPQNQTYRPFADKFDEEEPVDEAISEEEPIHEAISEEEPQGDMKKPDHDDEQMMTSPAVD